MRAILTGLAAASCLVLSVPAQAADRPDLEQLQAQLPGTLANDPARIDWPVYGPGTAVQTRRGDAIPGGGALEVTIPAKGATPYANGINVPLTRAVRQGDDVVVSFQARTVSAGTADGNGTVAVRFQQNAAPYAGFGDSVLAIGREWKLYEVTAKASRDLAKGEGAVGLQLGGAKQTLQIAQLIVQTGATSLVKQSAAPACKTATPVMMPQLAGRGTLLTEIDALNWDISGPVKTERFAACGIAGDSALRFTVPAAGAQPYDAVAALPLQGAIAAGDQLLVAIIARSGQPLPTSGAAKLGLRVQIDATPYEGFADNMVDLAPNWKLIQLHTTARIDVPQGKGVIALHLAAQAQTLELGRVYVIKLPPAAQ